MSKLEFSPAIVNETAGKGVWTKERFIMLRGDDGSLTKVGVHLDAIFEVVEEGAGTDYMALLDPVDFTLKKHSVKYLFNEEMNNLKQEKFYELRNR